MYCLPVWKPQFLHMPWEKFFICDSKLFLYRSGDGYSLIANLKGVDMFAKIQDAVAYLMVGSMVIMGVIGMLGLGTGKKVSQPMVLSADWKTIVSMTALHSGCLLVQNM